MTLFFPLSNFIKVACTILGYVTCFGEQIMNMFVLAKITLFVVCLALVHGQNNNTDVILSPANIVSGIDRTGAVVASINTLIQKPTHGYRDVLNVITSVSTLGATFFPSLVGFSSAIKLFSQIIAGGASADQLVMNKLVEIKQSLDRLERAVENLVPQITQVVIKQRFYTYIEDPVYHLHKSYNEFANQSDQVHRNKLIDKCISTNEMKDVLTSLHKDIAKGGEGKYVELLDGGVSDQL